MMRIPRKSPVVAVGLIWIMMAACAINPVTGKKELMLVSESMEIQMGAETDVGIRQEYGIYEDAGLNEYLTALGQRMAPITHRPALPYHFAVLDTEVVNAFAAPGGYIYVTRGMLAQMNDEAALVSILGHELGHVNARHGARSMTRNMLMLGGLLLGSLISEDVQKIMPFAVVGLQLLFLKYSRDDEYQADSLGVQYSRRTGYAPDRVIPLFRSFLRMEGSSSGIRLPNFLSTHPLTTSRIDEIQKMLSAEDENLSVDRNGYMARINGLVFGENPRQGYIEGNAFYHPDMQFAIQIPQGWKMQNTPKQVIMAPDNEKAMIFLTAEPAAKDLAGIMQDKLSVFADSQVKEMSRASRTVNGLNGLRALFSVRPKSSGEGDAANAQAAESQNMTVEFNCIQKGTQIFTFTGTAAASDFQGFEGQIETIVRSFRRLTDADHLNRSPRRLSIVTAQNGETLQALLQRMSVPQKQWDEISLINSMLLKETLGRGQMVKVVR